MNVIILCVCCFLRRIQLLAFLKSESVPALVTLSNHSGCSYRPTTIKNVFSRMFLDLQPKSSDKNGSTVLKSD